ncbi:putative F-box/FBD/LRR-repeat protein At5g25850 [Rosa rugosa]|uniref:putative F-box/FBD/LRR-repeat protein At5g25850 n=1 Tax=Rosa rugosa TaxID=74645 RepID=UPI002B40A20F|nr:putative F-box/FBD/LRR-repeat protein At5g25850 [Rosa rugosa]
MEQKRQMSVRDWGFKWWTGSGARSWTQLLQHRWKNVWASVPNLDFDEEEYELDYVIRTVQQPVRYESDWFAEFVNSVLLFRCPGDIQRFCLVTTKMHDVSLIDAWVSTAIKHNVVELVLRLGDPPLLDFDIPRCVFMCNTLVSLELFLHQNICAVTPPSNCFPCLKLLNVTFWYPDSHTLEKLFSCFPVLEDLIIHGEASDGTLSILLYLHPNFRKLARITVANDSSDENYGCQTANLFLVLMLQTLKS